MTASRERSVNVSGAAGLAGAILAVDEGTSGTRAALVGRDGSVSHVSYAPLSISSPRHGVVEQDADLLLDKTIEVCRSTIDEAKAAGVEIVAMALATQRSTGVLWDRQTGAALVPAMVWQDSRYADALRPFADGWDARLLLLTGRHTGQRSVYYWAAQHISHTSQVREAWEQGRLAFGTVDSWLLWHLSELARCVTTPTNAVSAGAYVLAEHRYLADWVEALSFPPSLLPHLMQDADDFGRTNENFLGIRVPILASCGDQQAALLGLGCHEAGQAMCVHGTGSFVNLAIGGRGPEQPGLFDATFPTAALRQNGYTRLAVETYASTTGSALAWLCDEMRWFDSAREVSDLAATVSSAEGLCFMPTLSGLRQPRIVPQGRAALTGLCMAHRREHLAYAVLEGIAHSVASCVRATEQTAGLDVSEIAAGGGLSASDVLLQLQADLGGVPVRRMPGSEHASLRGAAFLAGSRGLFWSDLSEARRVLPEGIVFTPSIDPAERAERRRRWERLGEQEEDRVSGGLYR